MLENRIWAAAVLIAMEISLSKPVFAQSEHCFCAEEILRKVESGDENGAALDVSEQANQCATFSEGREHLESLIDEINRQYGLKLTFSEACRLIAQNIDRLDAEPQMKELLLATIMQIELGDSKAKIDPHLLPAAYIDLFGKRFYWPWEWSWFGLNPFEAQEGSEFTAYAQTIEFQLPPKITAGLICALGGALVFSIPGAQAIGSTLIGTGLALAMDGVASGECPFYPNRK